MLRTKKAAETKGASRCRPASNLFAITPDLWQYDAVDDVDDAIGCIKVGGSDMRHAAFGVGQHDRLAHYRCGQIAALDSSDNSLATACFNRSQDVLGHQFASDNMIGQYRLELRLVFWLQQSILYID